MAEVEELLARALSVVPGSQPRAGQQQMASAVTAALADGHHLLVQAGTGTGKSLAYLVPALAHGEVVVVATATKALQAQLVDKDLPRLVAALAPVLGRTPTFALAKGRGNYLCRQRIHDPGAHDDGQGELVETPGSRLGEQVVRLRGWADETVTGDRDEVPFAVDDRAWRQVSVSARECLGARCAFREECFAEAARATAREADVVVANHALLALDLVSGMPVLPEHEAVIVDEAHELAASLTEAMTLELTRTSIERAVTAAADQVATTTQERVREAAAGAQEALGLLTTGWLRRLPDELHDSLALLAAVTATALAEIVADAESVRGDPDAAARHERDRAAVEAVAEAAAALTARDGTTAVYVVDDGFGKRLRVSPLSVGGVIAGRLLPAKTVVATSATLTLGGSFRHPAAELGLSWAQGRPAVGADPDPSLGPPGEGDGSWRYADVGSPFDYPRQGQLHVARSLPEPTSPAWPAAVDELLVRLVTAAGGRTLALFSSTAAARRAAASVRAASALPVLLQGEDSAGALAHAFAADPRACLFGTRSFWQGVDTPGSACQLVVIDRIPFGHREDPLVQAKVEAAARAGRNGFAEVVVPAAAVLLAQGAGRLIRSVADRGVVVVLDPRLATASYARVLRDTLPDFYPAHDLDRVLASLAAIDADAPPPVDPGEPPAERRRARAVAAKAARTARPPARAVPVGRGEPPPDGGASRSDCGVSQPAGVRGRWTGDEDALLRNGLAQGRSLAQLAERHEVSADDLLTRCQTLGLDLPTS